MAIYHMIPTIGHSGKRQNYGDSKDYRVPRVVRTL